MVRTFTIDKTYKRILSYLSRGDTQKQICKFMGLKPSNLSKRIKRLEKNGYITKEKIGRIIKYHVKNQNGNYSSMGIQNGKYHEKVTIRLHDLFFSFKILNKPDNWGKKFIEKCLIEKSLDYSRNDLRNWSSYWFDYNAVKVRVTPNKVIVKTPNIEAPLTESPENMKNRAFNYLEDVIPRIENVFRIKLTKPRKVSISVSSQHIAFCKDELAQFFTRNKIPLRIYDRDTGKIRVLVDKSRGPEMEFINGAFAEEDAEAYKRFLEDVITGEFDHRNVLKAQALITRNQLNQEKNINMLIEAVNRLTEKVGD